VTARHHVGSVDLDIPIVNISRRLRDRDHPLRSGKTMAALVMTRWLSISIWSLNIRSLNQAIPL
jgi:hypothetical protein